MVPLASLEADGGEPSKKKKKTDGPWFDERDSSKAIRLWNKALQNLDEVAGTTKVLAMAAAEEFAQPQYAEKYLLEKRILSARVQAMTCAMNSTNADPAHAALELTKMKDNTGKAVEGGEGDSAHADGIGDGASTFGLSQMVNISPCMGFGDIRLYSDLKAWESDIHACRTSKDLTLAVSKAGAAKRIYDNLFAAVKAAVNDLYSAKAADKKQAMDKAAAQEKRKKELEDARKETPLKRQRKAGDKIGIFSLSEGRHSVPVFTEDEFKAVPCTAKERGELFTKPFIIRGVEMAGRLEVDYKAELEHFKEQFEISRVSCGISRGQIRFKMASNAKNFTNALMAVFKDNDWLKGPYDESLTSMMWPACWGYAPKATLSGFERSMMASLRLTSFGTRSIAVARFSEVGEYVRSIQEKAKHSKPWNTMDLKVWTEECNEAEIKQCLASGAPIYWATLSPGDVLYLPVASFIVEQVMNNDCVRGVKLQGIARNDALALTNFRAGQADIKLAGTAENPVMKQIIRIMESMEPQATPSPEAPAPEALAPEARSEGMLSSWTALLSRTSMMPPLAEAARSLATVAVGAEAVRPQASEDLAPAPTAGDDGSHHAQQDKDNTGTGAAGDENGRGREQLGDENGSKEQVGQQGAGAPLGDENGRDAAQTECGGGAKAQLAEASGASQELQQPMESPPEAVVGTTVGFKSEVEVAAKAGAAPEAASASKSSAEGCGDQKKLDQVDMIALAQAPAVPADPKGKAKGKAKGKTKAKAKAGAEPKASAKAGPEPEPAAPTEAAAANPAKLASDMASVSVLDKLRSKGAGGTSPRV